MSEILPALQLEWIKRIFLRFNAVYGPALMRGTWGDGDLAEVWNVWADELKNFGPTPGAIKYALEHLPSDYPPNILQFREICREGLKHEPKPLALDHKMTPEQLEANKIRIKEILKLAAMKKAM